MIRKLKTLDQIKEENPGYHVNQVGGILITPVIVPEMFKYFGEEIEVKESSLGDGFFVYNDAFNSWYFNKDWFEPEYEPIEFITKEEMEI